MAGFAFGAAASTIAVATTDIVLTICVAAFALGVVYKRFKMDNRQAAFLGVVSHYGVSIVGYTMLYATIVSTAVQYQSASGSPTAVNLLHQAYDQHQSLAGWRFGLHVGVASVVFFAIYITRGALEQFGAPCNVWHAYKHVLSVGLFIVSVVLFVGDNGVPYFLPTYRSQVTALTPHLGYYLLLRLTCDLVGTGLYVLVVTVFIGGDYFESTASVYAVWLAYIALTAFDDYWNLSDRAALVFFPLIVATTTTGGGGGNGSSSSSSSGDASS